jgi:hypothetical protein
MVVELAAGGTFDQGKNGASSAGISGRRGGRAEVPCQGQGVGRHGAFGDTTQGGPS